MGIGIPYAYAFIDDQNKYFVSCPRCGQRCYGELLDVDDSDEIPKLANRGYAEHWEKAHRDETT